MKRVLKGFLLLFFFLLLPIKSFAYTLTDVAEHNTSDDCWVVFQDNVYDLSEYLPSHDRYLDIRRWCGKDMTDDFKNKSGVGRNHTKSSYALLERYNIGKLGEVEESDTTISILSKEKDVVKGYNLIVPLLISFLAYWVSFYLIKKQIIKVPVSKFNGFWNTVLMLFLLIPSFGFGVFMMIRTKKPELYSWDFDFMYWHVELSVVMGSIAISHFLQRLNIFKSQIAKK